MRKLIIVDDRPKRQERDLGNEVLEEIQKLKFVELSTSLADKIGHLEEYTLIAVHRSYLVENNLLTTVLEEVRNQNIYLVIFSGNISQNVLMEEWCLNIKSTDFYNPQTLMPFLINFDREDSKIKLLQLAYGEDFYELPLLFNIRNKFWINTNQEITDDDDLLFEIRETAKSLGFKSNNLEEIRNYVSERICRIINSH